MLEYVVVVACFILAFVAMRRFLQGSVMFKYKDSVDKSFGGQFDPEEGRITRIQQESGRVASVIRPKVITAPLKEGETEPDQVYMIMNYQAGGNDELLDEDGNRVNMPGNLRPMTARSYEYSDYEWKDRYDQ